MKHYDISEWVKSETNNRHRTLREAIHTVLHAISTGHWLQCHMILKGGILLAIRYNSERFTEDIDFSTDIRLTNFDEAAFLQELESNLTTAVETLDYGLNCKIQSHKFDPKDPNSTFPTFKLTIGYAYKDDKNSHKRLLRGQSLNVVKIDYSLNEHTSKVDSFTIFGGGILSAYSYTDLVAEKLRAILQQKDRKRNRRQDAYDLYCIFKRYPVKDDEEKLHILDCLKKKSASRNLEINNKSMSDPEIRERSKREYDQLAPEIEEELPEFETVFSAVENFYKSLPW